MTFELPLNNQKVDDSSETDKPTLFHLDDEVKDMDVSDYTEIIPVTEANDKGETRYVLEEDYMSFDSSMNPSKVKEQKIDDIIFERKTVDKKERVEEAEEIDPFNSPISDLLKERANERRRKMKDFNYKFNSAKIDEIEKEPAYKRQGVNLDHTQHSSETNASRMSIGNDENDEIQIRRNNSFLHDNVD